MRTIRVAATAVALGLLVTTGALAQTEDRPTNDPSMTAPTTEAATTVTGKVTSVNVSGRSFTVESPTGTMTFQTGLSTQITAGTSPTAGSMATLSNLKVGDEVRVAYSGAAGATPMAARVEVMGTRLTTPEPTGSAYGTTGTTATTGTMGTTSPTPAMSVSGKVVAVDATANAVTVETTTGPQTFKADASTRFLSSGRSVTLSELHEGDNVVLSLTGTGPDRMISRAEVTQGSYSARTTTSTTTTPMPPATDAADADDDLPATASPIFAILAGGIVLLTSGYALRRRRRA